MIAGSSAVRRNVSSNFIVQVNRVLGVVVATIGVLALFQVF